MKNSLFTSLPEKCRIFATSNISLQTNQKGFALSQRDGLAERLRTYTSNGIFDTPEKGIIIYSPLISGEIGGLFLFNFLK